MAQGTMPWQVASSKGEKADEHFKYQYHPGGDKKKALKDAPSALNSVIIPNVTLTRVSLQNLMSRQVYREKDISVTLVYLGTA